MINSFLVTLHNDGTQPVNPASLVGDVLWPTSYLPKVYTGAAELANRLLFDGYATSDFEHFLIAIQLLFVVEESVLVDTILADDPRATYSTNQLLGQFISMPGYDLQQISRILGLLDQIKGLEFLDGELLQVYRSTQSPLDKLAAVVAYFGRRDG